MFRKYRKEITWLGLFILSLVLIGAGLYLLAHTTTTINAVVIIMLATLGLGQIISSICKGIDVIVDHMFKDDNKHITDNNYDDDDDVEEKSIIVWCNNEPGRVLLMHEYVARLLSYNIDIESMVVVDKFCIFYTSMVRVEFAGIGNGLYNALYCDERFDCTCGFDESLLDYILEQHGISNKDKEDVNYGVDN